MWNQWLCGLATQSLETNRDDATENELTITYFSFVETHRRGRRTEE